MSERWMFTSGGFATAPVGLLEAAREIVRRHALVEEKMPGLIDRDGERFCAGYLEGLGQAVDLVIGHIAETEGA